MSSVSLSPLVCARSSNRPSFACFSQSPAHPQIPSHQSGGCASPMTAVARAAADLPPVLPQASQQRVVSKHAAICAADLSVRASQRRPVSVGADTHNSIHHDSNRALSPPPQLHLCCIWRNACPAAIGCNLPAVMLQQTLSVVRVSECSQCLGRCGPQTCSTATLRVFSMGPRPEYRQSRGIPTGT